MPALKKFLFPALRILVGGVFIISAWFKLFPIEPFELYVYSFPYLGWNAASILAVLIISIELTLGLLLLSHFYSKRVSWLILLLLSAFTIYLIIRALQGDTENCHCFGEAINLDPKESIVKNLILIALLVPLLFDSFKGFRKPWLVGLLIIVFGLSIPVILRPPDIIYKKHYSQRYAGNIYEDLSSLYAVDSLKTSTLKEGRKVVFFLSTSCPFCRLAAQKTGIMNQKIMISEDVLFVFTGKEDQVASFLTETESTAFNAVFLPPDQFFPLSGKHLPSIYFLENGKIVKNFGYRGIFQKDFESFLTP